MLGRGHIICFGELGGLVCVGMKLGLVHKIRWPGVYSVGRYM